MSRLAVRYAGTVRGFRRHCLPALRRAAVREVTLADNAAEVRAALRRAMLSDAEREVWTELWGRISALERRLARAEQALAGLGLRRCPECGRWQPEEAYHGRQRCEICLSLAVRHLPLAAAGGR